MRNRTTTAAIILSLAAAGAPAASAKPADFVPPSHQTPASVYSRPDKSIIPLSSPYPSGSDPTPATVPQAVVRVQTAQSGFDWGDAGIGAAGGLALSLIGSAEDSPPPPSAAAGEPATAPPDQPTITT